MTESRNERERRRKQVFELLKLGTAEKMMVNRSRPAVETLTRAYELARDPTPIVSPLYEIAAYRLANVLLRSARSMDDLQAVERLYAEATGDVGRRLGPMPFIHRIAALYRLAVLNREAGLETQILREQMDAMYAEACQLVRTGNFGVPRGEVGAAHIQGSLHNLLELTAYYNDFDYEERIGGLVSPFEDLVIGEDWMIVGTGGVDDSVRMPRDLAAIELEARMREGADLVFELGRPRKRARFRAWVPGDQHKQVGGRELLTLAQLCRSASDRSRLYEAVYGEQEEFDEERLRDVLRDLRRFLNEMLKEPGEVLLPEVPTGQPLSLRPGLRIYGMVTVDSLRGYQ